MLENYIINNGPIYDVFSQKHREIPATVGLTKLQLGSYDVIHGYTNILELQSVPWNIANDSISEIIVGPIICQVVDLFYIINECWRVLTSGGLLIITAPFVRSDSFTRNPRNVVPMDENTMGVFCVPWCKQYNLPMPIGCDLDPLTIEFEYVNDWKYRSKAAQNFGRTHYYNVVDTIRIALTAVKPMRC